MFVEILPHIIFDTISLIAISYLLIITLIPRTKISLDIIFINQLWEEIKKITNLSPDTAPPVIILRDSVPYALGNYTPNKKIVEIYLQEILYSGYGVKGVLSYFLKRNTSFFYYTVAHEMLHCAIDLKKPSPPHHLHHLIMKDAKYLEKAIDFIDYHFKINNQSQKIIAISRLNISIKKDLKIY